MPPKIPTDQSGSSSRIVIVGAGIAGLAAALRLSAVARDTGREVLVLERQAAPGGKMRTLPSDAGPVDAGPTVLTMRPVFEALFVDAGARLEDHVTLIPQDILARHWWPDGSRLDLHANPDASAAAIRAFAGPKAEREFRAFSKRAAQLFKAFDAPMMQAAEPSLSSLSAYVMRNPTLIPAMAPQSTLADMLARQFSDPRLAQLFGRYATYVGGSPYRSPAILALIWQAEAAGVWCVKGGMHQLAKAIADLAAARGVQFHYGAHVERIEAAQGRVRAVHLADGQVIAAETVLFNGAPCPQERLAPTWQPSPPPPAAPPAACPRASGALPPRHQVPILSITTSFFAPTRAPNSQRWKRERPRKTPRFTSAPKIAARTARCLRLSGSRSSRTPRPSRHLHRPPIRPLRISPHVRRRPSSLSPVLA